MSHIPVLLHEAVDGLSIEPDDRVLDMTAGEGGHGSEIVRKLSGDGVYIGIDADGGALKTAQEKLSEASCQTIFFHGNFREFEAALAKAGVSTVDAVLFDLGFSTLQLEESGRGFSFQKDEPLVMTFSDTKRDITAETAVNEWSEETLSDVIEGFGGERYGRRIARAIAEERKKKAVKTTKDLVAIIEKAVPKRYLHGRIHPATRTFQALRVAVNRELEVLDETLRDIFPHLTSGGRIAVISFHSLEDRLVKRFFRGLEKIGKAQRLFKKPIQPSREEVASNPRSRSAKLRIIEKL